MQASILRVMSAAAIVWLSGSVAHACSCRGYSLYEISKMTHSILEVRVIEVSVNDSRLVVRLQVLKRIRGNENGEITITTPSGTTACGLSFKVGEVTTIAVDDGKVDACLPARLVNCDQGGCKQPVVRPRRLVPVDIRAF